jgi:hypothetical protein
MLDFFLAHPWTLVGVVLFALWAVESLARRLS